MDFTCLFFGIVFLLIGILFAYGKLHTHIKAWTAMPEDEKEKINIRPLCMNIGSMISLCGDVFLAAGLFPFFRSRLFVRCMIFWMIAAGIDAYFIGKNGRYRR